MIRKGVEETVGWPEDTGKDTAGVRGIQWGNPVTRNMGVVEMVKRPGDTGKDTAGVRVIRRDPVIRKG